MLDVECDFKESRLTPPNSVGLPLIINGKDPMVFNFGSKALCSVAKIAPLCGMVTNGDAKC